ncbi:universal stress protein [Sodalinema gerasimenkoae]|uniref:universal stress protein n=1 Tax=Sodalinema gerasimenkoae TaxID=2862348 RepID=UPI001FE727FF|nr:universal stress protein [Sodalinema gerasimenkoae]
MSLGRKPYMFQNLLICTDLQDGLHRLVRFVPSFAASGVRKLVFFHSVRVDDDRGVPKVDKAAMEAARQYLSIAQENVPDGVEVEVVVESDRIVENILHTIKTHHCNLVLLGTDNKTLLNEKLFGSTTAELVERIKIPLLVIRPALMSTYTEEELDLRCRHLLRYLLIAYDGSNTAQALVQQITQVARDRPENSLNSCLLAWAIESKRRRDIPQSQTVEDAEAILAEVKQELEQYNLTVTTQVREQERLKTMMDLAMEYDISAIAVNSPSVPRLLEWSRPNFANLLLRRSWHPVLFFPDPD